MIEHIPEMIGAGIDSFKIEGRMKTALYVATVARTYRKAIDDYLEDEEKYRANMPWYLDQISNCTYRQFTTGFYFGKPDETSQIYDNNTYVKEYTYLGIIGGEKDGMYRIEQRNKFSVGEQIEIMKPDGRNVGATVQRIVDEEGNDIEVECIYNVFVPIEDMGTVYSHIAASLGVTATGEQQSNADNVYSLVKYGYPVTGEGGAAFEGADVPYVGADGFCSPVGAGWRNIVTSEFGGRIDPITGQRDGHTGMDLAVPTGTPVRAALPEAEERISWSMPTFRKGHNIIQFAAHKNHIGLYAGTEAVIEFAERLKDCKTSKGTIQLSYDCPLPSELIREIARWCYETGNHP